MSGRVNRALALATAPGTAARRHPDTALYLDEAPHLFPDAGTDLDYRSFAGLVERAAALLAGAGVGSGERVLIVKRPNVDVPLLAFACARIGALPVLIHPAVGSRSLAVLLSQSEPTVLVTDGETLDSGVLPRALPDGPSLFVVGPSSSPEARLDEVAPVALPPASLPAGDAPQLVTHSSGTTGVPKLVLHTVRSFAGHARPQVFIGRMLRVRDPYLMCFSPVHARCLSGLLAALSLGLPLGFMTDPAPQNALRMLNRVRPGVVETVPNVFIRWEELAETQPEALGRVRLFLSSFDAVHPRTVRTMLGAARSNARYLQAYGQTETGPITVKSHRTGRGCEDGRCVGHPVPGHTKIKISGETGRKARRGSPGAIGAKSSGVTPSYLGLPDQRVDGWWAMGDYGVRTRRGCLHLYDRLLDRGSDLTSLLAVEDTLLDRLPQLTEAVLIPMEGAPPVPVVCTRSDQPLDETAWASANAGLPELARPVRCRWEDIPHTATWKVKRAETADRLRSGKLQHADAVGGRQEAGSDAR